MNIVKFSMSVCVTMTVWYCTYKRRLLQINWLFIYSESYYYKKSNICIVVQIKKPFTLKIPSKLFFIFQEHKDLEYTNYQKLISSTEKINIVLFYESRRFNL